MENETKLALFVGGNADGFTQEITTDEPRLNCSGDSYISRGLLETKTLGTVRLYVFGDMESEEEARRMAIIKKVL